MEKEIWKDIPNYEGIYQASTLGRIRSLDMELNYHSMVRKPYTQIRKGRVLKAYCDSRGYRHVGLYKNGESEKVLVHRLVAMAFLENPMNYRNVVFKDGDKSNITPDNLKWV